MTDGIATDEDLAKMVDLLPTTRTCDGCDLCCTAVGVKSLDKPPAVRCGHLCGEPGKSCSIYDTRPMDCRTFVCLWRGSDTCLPPELFPATVGFVIALSDVNNFPLLFTVHPDPDRPGAWNMPLYRNLFFWIARRFNAIVVIGQHPISTHIFSPTGHLFSKRNHPHLFTDDGRVGLPENEFTSRRLTFAEVTEAIWDIEPVKNEFPGRKTR